MSQWDNTERTGRVVPPVTPETSSTKVMPQFQGDIRAAVGERRHNGRVGCNVGHG